MKRFVTLILLALTSAAAAPATNPAANPAAGRSVEICFVLDTTGSMGGLIDGAKRKIWAIANNVITAKPKPASIRIALVGYRDRGDTYVTQVFDLTDDIDAVYKHLQTFEAGGGGDTPESVNQALDEAVEKVGWSRGPDVYKVVFLVGDAPPHMDYKDDVKYPVSLQHGVRRHIIFNTVQCGDMAETTPVWQDIARLGEGAFVQLGQTGDMVAISTPMDGELATLNRQVGKTLVPYGVSGALREHAVAAQAAKQMASESATLSVAADRLAYNAASGKAVQGNDELIDAIGDGRVKLADLKDDQLPADLRALPPAGREKRVAELTAERAKVRTRIADLSKQRADYIAAEQRKAAAANGKADSFDGQVAKIIAEQVARPR